MTFIGGNFTKAMIDYSEEKIEKLSKYTKTGDAVVCYSALKDDKFKVEISLNNQIRATAVGVDFYALIGDVVNKLELQIKRFKSTATFKEKHHGILVSDDADSEVEDDLIEKEKVVILDEISSDEAIDEMELLGHNFYVYRDIDRKAVCIVYKRADGTYGLMETR